MLERVARFDDDFGYAAATPERRAGIVARVVGAVFRHPGRALSLIVILGGTAAIVANATFFQTGEHPAPIMATRPADSPTVAAPTPTVPLPAARPGTETSRQVAVTAEPARTVQASPPSTLVIQVQQMLADLGYNPGPADGLMGTRTRTAIEAFQRDQGLTRNGTPDEALLGDLQVAAAERQAAAAQSAAAPAPTPLPEGTARIRAVQTALNQSGYGPVPVNGTVDAVTAEALQGFQLNQNLPTTGQADAATLARLVAIGALAAE